MSNREYPDNPIAGVGVVVMKDDHVLMIRRGREPRIGQWSIPGGKQELGETWREAATREVLEETSVEIEIIGIVDVVDAIIRNDDSVRPGIQALNEPPSATPEDSRPVKYHYTLVDCAALWTTGEPLAGGDAAHAEWWPLNRIDELSLWAETVRIIHEAAAIAATHS
jgi:8-oxo-dGTP diphosphatase